MRLIPVASSLLLRRCRSVLIVVSTQRLRHLALQRILKHHLSSRPDDLREIHLPKYQLFLERCFRNQVLVAAA